ncbi:hypothetical protein [Mastigocoleus sp. MO_188.B34]|uniref:hypothetical protein n=1 Tax=Mastigocoleus sp. MO_188.B34 TaxID=3036635 RepID=UPI0026028371|nr:hypothetical protein [Mastigocoleus sp. MO_188.B34]MDJ0696036.1 hypothetical protein [Mastigocoleus sp. MO_188.B34]
MTLCAAWIREKNNVEELVFATDSSLTGGEKWNQGIKLFELPRPDCLICFAGSTARAYPLILNLISSIKLSKRLQSNRTDIEGVLDYLSSLFTSLVNTIVNEVSRLDIHCLRSEAKFLFGGWSWVEGRFRIWELYYSKDAEGFVFKEYTEESSKTGIYAFMGEPEELTDKASKRYKDKNFENDKLDMEPLQVLVQMSRDKNIREVDGATQIAKVYKSGTSEFFGIYWESIQGKPYFQGRAFDFHSKPDVRYFDPDTLTIIEDKLPNIIDNLSQFNQLGDFEFICSCYENGCLKEDIAENDRERLIYVFREAAYQSFIENLKNGE